MNLLLKSKKYRGYLLFASYSAWCLHLTILAGYFSGLGNHALPQVSYLSYLFISIICITIYIMLALSNEKYLMALLKTAVALPLLFLNENHFIPIIILFSIYHLLAFFDVYDYKVNI